MATFEDMMSSARGPGFIGTVLALVVLVGFSALFLLVFDDSTKANGGLTLEGLVRRQDKDIENLHTDITNGQKSLERLAARTSQADELESITSATRTNTGSVTGLKNRLADSRKKIEDMQVELIAYKAKYRASMREKATGEKIDQLTTISGKVFKNVSIREVTPIGMQIRHDDGFSRIPYEDLPLAMQERFQFDPKEKQDASNAESASEKQHLQSVASANAQDKVKADADRVRQAEDDHQKRLAQIATMENRIQSLGNDINDLQRQAEQARSQMASARAAGHMAVDRTPNILAAIQVKRNQQADLTSQIQALKAKN